MKRLFPTVFVLMMAVPTFAADWGSIEGQFVLEEDVPVVPPVVKEGDATVRDPAVCAAVPVPDDSLVLDPETKGIANIFVFMRRAPRSWRQRQRLLPN